MRFEAHPLVVAAALGLLGPAALIDDEEDELADAEPACGPSRCSQRATGPSSSVRVDDGLALAPGWDDSGGWTWSPQSAPDPEDFHRVELEWLARERG